MLTPVGILLLVAGAILTFAVERQTEGVDLQLVGWIVMAGGALALIVAMVRAAALESVAPCATVHDGGYEAAEVHEERRAA